GDLRALGQIHVWVTAFHDTTDERDRHSRLDGGRTPAELFDELLRTTKFRSPSRSFPPLVHVKDDQCVRVHHHQLNDGAFESDGLFVVAARITVMRPCQARNQAANGQDNRAEKTLLHVDDTSHKARKTRRRYSLISLNQSQLWRFL